MAASLLDPNALLADLELFFGEANDALARVYARLPRNDLPPGVRLDGTVNGPDCKFAATLPSPVPLVEKKVSGTFSETPLAEAVVPDPCFWTPELPFLYRVRVELRRGADVLAAADRMFGIRRLGVKGRNLFLEGKRFVIRGVGADSTSEHDLVAWRAADAAMIIRQPSDDVCRQASEQGVLLLAEIRPDIPDPLAELRRLSRWPAVGVAILDSSTCMVASSDLRAAARNLLLAQRTGSAVISAEPLCDWAQLIVAETTPDPLALNARLSHIPIIVRCALAKPVSLPSARAACDLLQRDLAPVGDFAGYVV